VSNSEEESHNKIIIVQPLSIANHGEEDSEGENRDDVRQLPSIGSKQERSPLIEEDKSEEMASPFVLSPEIVLSPEVAVLGEGAKKPPLGFKKMNT